MTGTIQSFNFAGGMHLANQNYMSCFRTEQGMCEIQFATTAIGSFALDGLNNNPGALSVGDECTRDYIFFLSTRGARNVDNANRFCGSDLNVQMVNPQPGTIRGKK